MKWGRAKRRNKEKKERKGKFSWGIMEFFPVRLQEDFITAQQSTVQYITAQHILIRHSTAQYSKIE